MLNVCSKHLASKTNQSKGRQAEYDDGCKIIERKNLCKVKSFENICGKIKLGEIINFIKLLKI